MSVWTAFKTTTVASLTVVTTTANKTVVAVDSVGFLVDTAAAYAKQYRDDSIKELEVTSASRQLLRVNTAKRDVSRELKALELELASDPHLKAIFDSISDSQFTPSITPAA